MSSTTARGGRRWCTASIHWPGRSARAARFAGRVSHSVSKRPIWLAEAARPIGAWPPTTQRIAGSRHSRSASFTSSYPASRPNTDCRSNPTNRWRRFLPVRASANLSPPLVVSASTSSSSRYASNPQSEVIAEPWNRSITRRSKSSLSAPLSASPAGSAIAAPFDLTQHIVSYTIIWTISPQNAVPSGQCGLTTLAASEGSMCVEFIFTSDESK